MKKENKASWAAVALALIALAGTALNHVDRYYERQHDLELARLADQNRIEVDTTMQAAIETALGDVYTELDELHDELEQTDRELFEALYALDQLSRNRRIKPAPAELVAEKAEKKAEKRPDKPAIKIAKPVDVYLEQKATK